MVPDSSDLTPDGKETPGGRPAPMHSSASTKKKARKGKTLGLSCTGYLDCTEAPRAPPPRSRRVRAAGGGGASEFACAKAWQVRYATYGGVTCLASMGLCVSFSFPKQHIYWELFVLLSEFPGAHIIEHNCDFSSIGSNILICD